MGVTRHEKSFVDFEKPYEKNIVGLKGIVYFGVGLFLLIVITFALMWALLKVFEQDRAQSAGPAPPLMPTETERLPPEPRLQLAPGFKVDDPSGPVNLELAPPSAEYRAIRRQWEEIWARGQKDPNTGVFSVLPIEEAKAKLLEENVKARSDEAATKVFENSRLFYSDASSGRVAAERRR